MNVESFDLITKDRVPLNKTAARGSTLQRGEFHLVVMGVLLNDRNELLITKRSKEKPGAGKWECTAGSVLAGETGKEAILREIREEIGIIIEPGNEETIGCFYVDDAIFDIWKFSITSGLEDLVLQESEVDEARFIHISGIHDFVKNNRCASSLLEVPRLYDEGLIQAVRADRLTDDEAPGAESVRLMTVSEYR